MSSLVLAACGPGPANFSILPAGQNSYQGSVANNKVDILFVVDNSGTMIPKQNKLADEFNAFAQVFFSKDFDFRIAVVTTDTIGEAGIFQAQPTAGGDPAEKIVTKSMTDAIGHFKANIKVGIGGGTAAAAKPLKAVELALSPGLLAADNANFLRSDAHLAVIFVSDADDNDSHLVGSTPTTVQSFLQALKPDKFDVLARTYKKNYTVSAVAVNSLTEAACVTLQMTDPLIEVGTKYKSLVTGSNGSWASICEPNFASGLTQISQRIAEAITEIPLASVPDVSTIAIRFNGVLVAQDGTNGWTYESSGQKIVFHGSAIPQDNTSISIDYTPNDIIR